MEYKRQSRLVLVQAKSEAILLAADDVATDVIARFVDRAPSTVQQWLAEWRKIRLASVFTGHADNRNACKLTEEQEHEAVSVLADPPSEHGIPAEFWAPPQFSGWLQAHFGVRFESPSSYHFYFHLAGLSFHKPEKLDRRRADEQAIEARMAEIRAEIAPLLDDPAWLVLAADEVRIDQEAITRRAWYRRNTKTILKVDRVRQAQSFIGYLDQVTGKCELYRLCWQNADTILASLKQLVDTHPGKRICIVWDNATWHKNKLIRDNLGAGRALENIHLVAMPPYAPDHNPIEHVWKDTKEHTANIQHDNFEDTITAFENHITGREFHYTI